MAKREKTAGGKRYRYTDQPMHIDEHGTIRFCANRIVRDLLDKATAAKVMDMNSIAVDAQVHGKYTKEERQQFAQLIGYSVSGYAELTSYVTDVPYQRAWAASEPLRKKVAKRMKGGA